MRKTRLLGIVYACVCILFIPSIATSATLDFGIISPTAGSLSYGGGVAPLVGSGIDVDNVVGLGTPLNSNVTSICGSCTLDFQTGASSGGWNFGAGGTISINGTVDFPDATPDITLQRQRFFQALLTAPLL
jgi:hypothetical protein